jgi:hypothetical protein
MVTATAATRRQKLTMVMKGLLVNAIGRSQCDCNVIWKWISQYICTLHFIREVSTPVGRSTWPSRWINICRHNADVLTVCHAWSSLKIGAKAGSLSPCKSKSAFLTGLTGFIQLKVLVSLHLARCNHAYKDSSSNNKAQYSQSVTDRTRAIYVILYTMYEVRGTRYLFTI